MSQAPLVAGDDLGHHLALRHGAVGQHRLAGHVADGEDAAHGGAALLVDADEGAVHVEHQLLAAPALGQRPAADRDQHLVGRQSCARRRPPSPSTSAPPFARQAPWPWRPVSTSMPSASKRRGDRPGQFGVVERQDAVHRLDDRHLRAQLGEGGAELQPDIAAADHHQPLRQRGQRQRVGGRDHLAAEGKRGSSTGAEPVAMTIVSARMSCVPVSVSTSTVLPSRKRRPALDGLDLRLLQQAGDAAGEPADDAVLPGHGLAEVERRARPR